MSMPISISMSISVPLYFSPRDHLLRHTCLAGVGMSFPYYKLYVAVEAVPILITTNFWCSFI